MRVLLDTNAFIWLITEDRPLSVPAAAVICDPRTELFLSVASVWEIAIKFQLGNLELAQPPHQLIPAQLAINKITALPIQVSHALRVADLPGHHRDPFDRLLIAQALVEGLAIITSDNMFAHYGANVIW